MKEHSDDSELLKLRDALACGDCQGLRPPEAMKLVEEALRMRAELRTLRGVEEAADRVRRTTFPPAVVLCKGEASK